MREAYGGAGPWPLPIGETESSLHSSCRAVALSLSLGQATRPLGQATRAVALSHRAGPWLSPLVVASLLLAQRLLSLSLSVGGAAGGVLCGVGRGSLHSSWSPFYSRSMLSLPLHWPLTVPALASHCPRTGLFRPLSLAAYEAQRVAFYAESTIEALLLAERSGRPRAEAARAVVERKASAEHVAWVARMQAAAAAAAAAEAVGAASRGCLPA